MAAPVFALRPDLKPIFSRIPTASKAPAEKPVFFLNRRMRSDESAIFVIEPLLPEEIYFGTRRII